MIVAFRKKIELRLIFLFLLIVGSMTVVSKSSRLFHFFRNPHTVLVTLCILILTVFAIKCCRTMTRNLQEYVFIGLSLCLILVACATYAQYEPRGLLKFLHITAGILLLSFALRCNL